MNIWTICISEPLPIDNGRPRLMRAGMLTSVLRERGHEVTWWTSSFNHSDKCQRSAESTSVTTPQGIRLNLLHGVQYSRNVCFRRLVNHYQLGRAFRRLSALQPKPDVIFCCWPTIEIAFECVRYARKHSVPIVLDVRDLWPDIFLNELPFSTRGVANLVLHPYIRMTRFAFRHCSAIVGISKGYLEWGLRYAGRDRGPSDAVFPLGYHEPTLSPTSAYRHRGHLGALGVDDSRL